jgi:hypothetical protein
MKRITPIIACICCLSITAFAQNEDQILIEADDLRYQWDDEALILESFEGMERYCDEKKYRAEITDLLNTIHHYDTLLYNIVLEKYDEEEDLQAKEALTDILTVESEYTTPNFVQFLSVECGKVKTIEKHLRKIGNHTDSEIERLEKELVRYIDAVTERIDLIDENVHHLR